MATDAKRFYYWVRVCDGWAMGRSDSRAWALHTARRYAAHGIGLEGEPQDMRVIADAGAPSQRLVAEFSSGGRQVTGERLSEGAFVVVPKRR